jgi:integrase
LGRVIVVEIVKPHTPQRARGEGGLYEFSFRGQRRWRATTDEQVTWTDAEGQPHTKKKRITGTGDTPTQARTRLNDNLRKFYALGAEQQRANRRAPDTLGRYYEDTFLRSRRVREWKPDTRRGFRQRIEQHVLPVLGDKQVTLITRDEIRELFNNTLPEKNLAEASQVNTWRNLNTLLSDAVYDGKLSVNPMNQVRPSERPRRRVAELLDLPKGIVTDVQARVAGTEEEPLRMMSMMLGLRIGELLGLTWDCVHLTEGSRVGRLHVKQQLKLLGSEHGPGCQRIKETGKYRCGQTPRNCPKHEVRPEEGLYIAPWVKTTPRVVALVEPLTSLLRKQKERQEEWKQKPEWEPLHREKMDNLVFTSPTGKPLRQQRVSSDWRDLLRECGYEELSQHKARYIAATALLLNGTPLSVTSAILGHADSRITERIYAQINASDQQQHLKALGRGYSEALTREVEEDWKEYVQEEQKPEAEQKLSPMEKASLEEVRKLQQQVSQPE